MRSNRAWPYTGKGLGKRQRANKYANAYKRIVKSRALSPEIEGSKKTRRDRLHCRSRHVLNHEESAGQRLPRDAYNRMHMPCQKSVPKWSCAVTCLCKTGCGNCVFVVSGGTTAMCIIVLQWHILKKNRVSQNDTHRGRGLSHHVFQNFFWGRGVFQRGHRVGSPA